MTDKNIKTHKVPKRNSRMGPLLTWLYLRPTIKSHPQRVFVGDEGPTHPIDALAIGWQLKPF